jgi:hypothetical protein
MFSASMQPMMSMGPPGGFRPSFASAIGRDALQRLFDEAPTPVSLAPGGPLCGRGAGGRGAEPHAGTGAGRVPAAARDRTRWLALRIADKGRASSFVRQTLLNANCSFVG